MAPRYPVGKNELKTALTPQEHSAMIEEIAALPARLRAAVAGLKSEQMETPYRRAAGRSGRSCTTFPIRARRSLGGQRIPLETGLLIPSGKRPVEPARLVRMWPIARVPSRRQATGQLPTHGFGNVHSIHSIARNKSEAC
jgi:hypothetical protein